jgi:hypothetical protein
VSATPSELLTAAADRIRDWAEGATPGPWANGSDQTVVTILPTGLTRYLPPQRWGLKVASKVDDVDRAWITALSPAVAPHVEAWLRMAAEDYRRRAPLPKLGEPNPRSLPVDLTGAFGPTYWSAALDFAKLIRPDLADGDPR